MRPSQVPSRLVEEPTQAVPARGGRDAHGRFAAGNRGGPGNPFARQVGQLRAALIRRVREEDIEEIAFQLVTLAKLGNLAAIKLLFQYAVGRPTEAVNPDTLDAEEGLKEVQEELGRLLAGLPAEAADGLAALLALPPAEEAPSPNGG